MTFKVIRGQGQGEEMTSVPFRDYFSIPHQSSSVEFGITRYYNPWKLRHAGSQDRSLLSTCWFPLFVALCDHNPSTLPIDRQTDGRHACSTRKTQHCRKQNLQETLESRTHDTVIHWTVWLTEHPHHSSCLIRPYFNYHLNWVAVSALWNDPVFHDCDQSAKTMQLTLFWLAVTMANWVASQHTYCQSVQMIWGQLRWDEMRWDEMRRDELYECCLTL